MKVGEKLESAATDLEERPEVAAVKQKLEGWNNLVVTFIKKHPAQALFAAAGAGFLVAKLARVFGGSRGGE